MGRKKILLQTRNKYCGLKISSVRLSQYQILEERITLRGQWSVEVRRIVEIGETGEDPRDEEKESYLKVILFKGLILRDIQVEDPRY